MVSFSVSSLFDGVRCLSGKTIHLPIRRIFFFQDDLSSSGKTIIFFDKHCTLLEGEEALRETLGGRENDGREKSLEMTSKGVTGY